MESEEQGCEYLEYESLVEGGESVEAAVQGLHDESWKANFEALNSLRRLNKFRKPELITTLPDYIEKISVFIDSPRSSLTKLSLILITEIFSSFDPNLVPIATKLVNLLLIKSTNEKSFIKTEANKSIKQISENFSAVNEIVEIFRASCFHKSTILSQNAFSCLNVMLPRVPPSQAIEICLSLESCPRQGIKTGAKNFVKGLSVSWDGFQECVNGMDDRKKRIIEMHLAEKEKRTSLKDAIQAAKVSKTVKSECLDN